MFNQQSTPDAAARQAVAQDSWLEAFKRRIEAVAGDYRNLLQQRAAAHRRERYIDWHWYAMDDDRLDAALAAEFAMLGERMPDELSEEECFAILGRQYDRLTDDEILAFEAMVRRENSDFYFDDQYFSDEMVAARNRWNSDIRELVDRARTELNEQYILELSALDDSGAFEQAHARHERANSELSKIAMQYQPVIFNCDACGKFSHSHDESGNLIAGVGLWALSDGRTASYIICERCAAEPEASNRKLAAYFDAWEEADREADRELEEQLGKLCAEAEAELQDAATGSQPAAPGNADTSGSVGQNTGPQPQPSLAQRYKVRTLRDAYQPRPPIDYLVGKTIAAPSLNIFYGAPGTLKSMLLLDMATAVASGQPWLEPIPLTNKAAASGIAVKRAPVLWIDLDNGRRRTDERVEAFSRARKLPEDAPFHYISMPDPWVDASNDKLCAEITQLITELGARLVVIDNLGLITGDADEISADMTKVMGNLRKMAETSGAAIVLVHHQRKSNGTTGRKGETLRGHSSIEASLDLALCIEREEGKPEIVLIPTKVRDFDVPTFGAYFAYTHKPGTTELETARFYGQEAENATQKQQRQVETAVLMELRAMMTNGDPAPNQKQLKEAVRDRLTLDGVTVGTTKIGAVITEMVRQGKIIETPGATKNAKVYSVAHSTP